MGKANPNSPWNPIMYRQADREGVCSECNEPTTVGQAIFYLPRIHKTYCAKCMKKNLDVIIVGETI